MSTNAKHIVKSFYNADFVKDTEAIKTYLHEDVVLIWNSTDGLKIMKYTDIVDTFNEISRTYNELRIEISHVLEDENYVTIRYKYYIRTIENPYEELGIAHFITIWEIKDGKLYHGHQISQPVMSMDDSNGTYDKVKV
jgi:ketosteroid isomerase-like protein